jgi:hypothetical protein
MKLGEHAKFTAHVVGGFDLATERWTAKDQFTRTELHGISEVRMAAWKLADDKWAAFIREMAEKERFKLAEIEFFSRPNWRGLILKASHVSLARILLYR